MKPNKKATTMDKKQAGAFIDICPNTGYIRGVYISAMNDQQESIIIGTLARISKPNCWSWLKRLVFKHHLFKKY
jgi:hypothetical protein